MADLKMAIGWMNEGKKVRRSKWSEGAVIHKNKEQFFFNKEDYEAIDWEIYKEKSAIQMKIDTVYRSLKNIEQLNGTFVLKESIKLFAESEDSVQ